MIQKYTDQKTTVPDVIVQHSVFGYPKGFAFESIRSFVDCMLSGEEFKVSVQDAANTSLAILAIMESARTGMPVDVRY
jgi:predicted dehydrogenase